MSKRIAVVRFRIRSPFGQFNDSMGHLGIRLSSVIRSTAATIWIAQVMVGVVCLGLSSVSSQEIAFVHPPEFENVEGEGSGGTQSEAARFQQLLLGGETFAGLPATHRLITGFRWRPDSAVSSPESHKWPNFEARFSTTNQSLDGMSTRFADNTGADETLVYSGPITISTMNTGPVEGPKDFDAVVDFQTPFLYDPAAGNLLIDLIWKTPFTTPAFDACCVDADGPGRWISRNDGDFDAEFATASGISSGLQFIFIPEPSSAVLCLTGLLGLLGLRRRKLVSRRSSTAVWRRPH